MLEQQILERLPSSQAKPREPAAQQGVEPSKLQHSELASTITDAPVILSRADGEGPHDRGVC